MPKVTRQKLARGTKLYPEHFEILTDIKSHEGSAAIDVEQMNRGRGTYRVNLHMPYLGSDFLQYDDTPTHPRPYSVIFTLPPPQDFFDVSLNPNLYNVDAATPRSVLEEITFAFDQRAEAALITDHGYNSNNTVNPQPNNAEGAKLEFLYDFPWTIKLAILEKNAFFFEASTSYVSETEIFSVEIPSDAFTGKYFRLNPYALSDIEHEIHPYKSYIAEISFEDMYQGEDGNIQAYALPSVNLSMKFSHPLMTRDTSTTQNMPAHLGAQSGRLLDITLPNPGDKLEAGDETKSLSAAMYEVDELFRRRLVGGYDRFGKVYVDQDIQDDSGYEIITIPLMQNGYRGNANHSGPGLAGTPYWISSTREETGDRRIVPIVYPMTIHHVFLAFSALNYQDAPGGRVEDFDVPNATLQMEAGLAMGTGIRSDDINYSQIAGMTWSNVTPTTLDVYTPFVGSGNVWLFPMALVGSGGSGYVTQGNPIFVGRGTNHQPTRTNLDGVSPPTAGQETFLEARIRFSGLNAVGADEFFSGWGGHYMIVVAKKHMTLPGY